MDYTTIYNNLINKRKKIPITEGYKENHHILPKSLGGDNSKENLVALTGREHWVAHLLLHKIHRCSQTAHACNMMAMKCEERGIPRIRSSRTYEYIRKEHAKYASKIGKQRVGKKNGAFGSMWICNIETQVNMKILKDDSIPEGWVKGRNKWKKLNIKMILICSIELQKNKRIEKGGLIPYGWVKGHNKWVKRVKLQDRKDRKRKVDQVNHQKQVDRKNTNEINQQIKKEFFQIIYNKMVDEGLTLRQCADRHYNKSHVSLFNNFTKFVKEY
jgi:hypothetical protein